MNTHIEMLVMRIELAECLGDLLRGVRRSKSVARAHGVRWPLVRDAAYGAARSKFRQGGAL